jgi:hypothetical protein
MASNANDATKVITFDDLNRDVYDTIIKKTKFEDLANLALSCSVFRKSIRDIQREEVVYGLESYESTKVYSSGESLSDFLARRTNSLEDFELSVINIFGTHRDTSLVVSDMKASNVDNVVFHNFNSNTTRLFEVNIGTCKFVNCSFFPIQRSANGRACDTLFNKCKIFGKINVETISEMGNNAKLSFFDCTFASDVMFEIDNGTVEFHSCDFSRFRVEKMFEKSFITELVVKNCLNVPHISVLKSFEPIKITIDGKNTFE